MPNLANITVKKSDEETDITYTGLQPSSGDGSPAIWRQTDVAYPSCQPEFRVIAKPAKGKMGRSVRGTFVYPQAMTDSTTGITSVHTTAYGDFTFVLDKNMSQTNLDEAAAQFANLVASALVKSCMRAGFSAT